MADNNGSFAELVMETLGRMEAKIDCHLDEQQKLKIRVAKVERDISWYSRIAGGAATLCGIIITWLLTLLHRQS